MKPRGDSKLKTLPKPDQAKIIGWLETGTQRATLQKIAKDLGITTSPAALSDFYGWYYVTSQLEEAASLADQVKAELKDLPGFAMDQDKVNKAAQTVFEIQALKNRDAKLHIALRRQRSREETVRLARDQFEVAAAENILDRFDQDRLRQIAESTAPRAEKIAAIRAEFFRDVDELEKSGKVALPK
jgi:hypothetical protein